MAGNMVTLRRAIVLTGVLAAVLLPSVLPADASYPTVRGGSDGHKIHWSNSHTEWHWDTGLRFGQDYDALQAPTQFARAVTWELACCPNSQWTTHYDESAPNHIYAAVLPTNTPAVAGVVYDNNAAFHMTKMAIVWDQGLFDAGAFYTGTGTTPWNKIDAWAIAAEEWGHVQNIAHFYVGSDCKTMSNSIGSGSVWMCKRTLVQAEKDAAQAPYDLMHP